MAERVRIATCPLCGKSHEYELEIERKMIAGLATQPQGSRRAVFPCTFHCPKTEQSFQAEVTLIETPMRPIRSVTVLRVLDEAEG